MDDTISALTVSDVVTRVRQRPVLAVAPMMLGLLLSVAYVVLTPPTYSASASVKVDPVVADRYAGNINVSNIISMPTEMQVVQSTEVASLAAEKLGLDQRTVRRAIGVDSPQDTQVLNITYTAGSPVAAARGAGIVAASYLEYSKKAKQKVAREQYNQVLATIAGVEKQVAKKSTATLQDQLELLNASRRSLESLLANDAGSIINNPVKPTTPASPRPLVVIPAGIGLGAIAGLVLAVLWPSQAGRRAVPAPPWMPLVGRPMPDRVRRPVPSHVRPQGRPVPPGEAETPLRRR